MIQKLNRPKGNCIDCGKDMEIRGNRKRCVKCGIKEQHRITNEGNYKISLVKKEKKSKELNITLSL